MPTSVEPTAEGGFLIGDMGNSRIREVSADGTITTWPDGERATTATASRRRARRSADGQASSFLCPIGPLDIESTRTAGSLRRLRQPPDQAGCSGWHDHHRGRNREGGLQRRRIRRHRPHLPREIALTGEAVPVPGSPPHAGFRRAARSRPSPGCPRCHLRDDPYSGIQGGPDRDELEGGRLRDVFAARAARTCWRARASPTASWAARRRRTGRQRNADVWPEKPATIRLDGLEADVAVGHGPDLVLGGDGPDKIGGGPDEDRIDGGTGNDRIRSVRETAPATGFVVALARTRSRRMRGTGSRRTAKRSASAATDRLSTRRV